MDKFKDPSLQLGVVNLVATIGTSTYFYKRLESQQAELVKVTSAISSILARMAEWEKDEPKRREVIRGMREEVRRLESSISDNSRTSPFDVEELINSLEGSGIGSSSSLPLRKMVSHGASEENRNFRSKRVQVPAETEDNSEIIELIRNTGSQ